MKISKLFVSVTLVLSLSLAWFLCLKGEVKERDRYQACLGLAQESVDKGLYEQAIENYKQSLTYEQSRQVYDRIMEAYELLYAEEPSAYVRSCYIEDMALASSAYPKQAKYWKKQIALHMEAQNYTGAYRAATDAINHKAKDEELQKVYEELLYMVQTEYQLYDDFKTCLNGYISVFDGNLWKVIDDRGTDVTTTYRFAGLINDEGKGIYMNEIDARLLDKDQITRARFDLEIEDAGYYSESLDCVPVKVDGSWRYLKGDGSFLPGEYEEAGSFYNNTAAVKEKGSWYLIDETGERCSSKEYEDIKLDLYGCHIQGDVILAKEEDEYHLYDTDFVKIGDFACEEIDICIENGLIAFMQNGLWGYVNTRGEIVIEPQYAGAKSFSNHMAAVCNQEGKWGFLNREYKTVIDYMYLDAHYFTKQETCMVSTTEGGYQMQKYMFE